VSASGEGADFILAALEESSGRPLRAMLEISDRCNEVCVHCYQEQGKKGELSTEELEAVIDELARMGILVLTLSGGEATLRKDFLHLVGYARERGFALRIFTNGLTMTEALAKELGRLAVQVVEISVYSHRAEVHDFVTGVPGAFGRTIAGIRHLVAVGVDVHVKTPIMRLNEAELEAYVQFASDLGVSYSIDPTPLMPREGGDRSTELLSGAQDTLRWVLADERFGASLEPGQSRRDLSSTICGAGDTVHMEPSGELRPCTMLELPLGDARHGIEDSTRESRALAQLRKLSWRDAHGCRDCDLNNYCSRCYAAALSEVGDALAPYPSACRSARTAYEAAHGSRLRLDAESGCDGELGPYRATGAYGFTAFPDRVEAADRELAMRLGWVRREPDAAPGQAPDLQSGGLVQLRRPGARRARQERVPMESAKLAEPPERKQWQVERENNASKMGAPVANIGGT